VKGGFGNEVEANYIHVKVSVAAAILCNRFLNPALPPPDPQLQNKENPKKESTHESGPQNKNVPEIEPADGLRLW